VYATDISGSPLRLKVQLTSSEHSKTEAESLSPPETGRGRSGRGRGKGASRGGFKSPEERLSHKSSRLTERINQLEQKINSKEFPSDRERVLRWRLANLQEKLAFVKAQKESLEANPQSNVQTPETAVPTDVTPDEDPEKSSWRGGRRGRGGRGGCRRAMMEDGSDQPVRKCRKARVAPEIIANFRQCKGNLRAARESGTAEEIQSCLEKFQAAKAAKWEAMDALRAQAASNDEQKA